MNTSETRPMAVLGAGSWGTALAILLARNGHRTCLWGRDASHISAMAEKRCNSRFLPDIGLPESLQLHHDLRLAVGEGSDILIAVPSQGFRAVLQSLAPLLSATNRIAWATKGLEPNSGRLLHQVVEEVIPAGIATAVLSGPTFAREVAQGLPTAVTLASKMPHFAEQFAMALHNNNFRVYTSKDVVGVEVGGAVKNVLAIAAGIADGLGFGANTRAALITRGLVELMRLGVALGGQRETFMGLAGLGDIVLTCTDDQSRNRRLGLAIARGKALTQALAEIEQAVEGISTAAETSKLATTLGVDMPITEQVYQVLYCGKQARDAVNELLTRGQKAEDL